MARNGIKLIFVYSQPITKNSGCTPVSDTRGTFPTAGGPQSSVGAGLRMDSRNGGQPVGTGAYVGSPEPSGHGGYHPSDSSAHDRR